MSDASKAVFLSYASQDAEAAKRICGALRAAGIEVWFDQSELVGGDAWDQKIRKQIKECALFVPVISANTQARREGYFRIEWRLAAQRTHAIAEGTPFLLPIVIDETPEPAALVPVEFRDVQWTRLSVKETPESLALRIDRLLQRTDDSKGPVPEDSGRRAEDRARARRRISPAWLAVLIPVGATLLALGAVAVKKFRDGSAKPAAVAPVSEADQLVARGYEILNNFGYRRDDLTVAEDFLRRATEQAPGSARAWAARAYVNSLYLLRGWDRDEKRRQDTQTFANRALTLNPNDTDAMLALGYLFNSQGAFVQTEALMRTAMGLRPDDPRLPRSLGAALRGQQRLDESIATLQDVVSRFPRDPLVRYELGLSYRFRLDHDAALAEFEAALEIRPFASALLQKAVYLANYKGDLPGARAALDQIETIDRTEDRAVGTSMWVGLMERNPERVVAAAALTARTYLEDNGSLVSHGPKAITLALVHQVTGKEAVAQRYWQEAETHLRQRLHEQPNDLDAQARLAICLARLGRQDEAEVIATRLETILREQRGGPAMLMAYYYAGRGDAARALAYVRNPINRRLISVDVPLALNPWFDPIRGQPEFERAVADAADQRSGVAGGSQTVDSRQGTVKAGSAFNPEPRTQNPEPASGVNLDPKSVAVLAFANLSDDKDNEYFSDGISEELLNVLAKVPGLKVSARTSAFSFKGKGVAIPEIAKQLGVAYVVEGSVRKAGNRVRITAQLIKAADGFHVWSENFDRELKDIFAVQDEIAGLIAQNLSLKLGTTTPVGPINPEVFRLYLEGRQEWNTRVVAAQDRAEALFEQAIALDPKFARGYAGMADVWVVRAQVPTQAEIDRATKYSRVRDLADRALELDPNLAEAHTTRAVALNASGQHDAADVEFQRAIALNPNYATGHQWFGRALFDRGKIAVGLAELEMATRLDPLSASIASNYGVRLARLRRWSEALAAFDRTLAIQPGFAEAIGGRANALIGLGRGPEALAFLHAAMERPGSLAFRNAATIWQLALAGDRPAAEKLAAPILADPAQTLPEGVFTLYICLGQREAGFAFLEREPRKFTSLSATVFLDPLYDAVRDDPRFLRKLDEAGYLGAYQEAWAYSLADQKKAAQR